MIALFVVLSILKLDKAVLSILAGAGVLGLALAFAFQDISATFIPVIFLSIRRAIHLVDAVILTDNMGKDTKNKLRETEMVRVAA